MVRAWYMDSSNEDQQLPHMRDTSEFMEIEEVREKSGVLCFQVNADDYESCGELEKLKSEGGYNYSDVIEITREKLPNYDEKIKAFFEEHLHADEEVRLVLEGSGYFDVRDNRDQWIRLECVKGDLIILPAGIYHRFTLDSKNSIKAMRLFKGVPVWTPINRPADDHPARVGYMKSMAVH